MVVNVKGLVSILRDMGILREKRIPEIYFSASIEQRLSLVQGLLDQDGTISSNGNIEFTQSADHLPIVRGMVRLLRSLGIVVHEPHLNKAGYTLMVCVMSSGSLSHHLHDGSAGILFATQSGFNPYDVETNPAMAIRQRHQEDIQRASSLSDRWKP